MKIEIDINKKVLVTLGVVLLLLLSFSVPATIRFKAPSGSVVGWWGSDTAIIKVSNGRSYVPTNANLQTAIYSLNATNGGTVYIPIGTFAITSAVKIPDGVSLIGENNNGSRIQINVNYAFRLEGGNITIRDINFYTTTTRAYWFYPDTTSTVLNNVEISNCRFSGITQRSLISTSTDSSGQVKGKNWLIADNLFDNLTSTDIDVNFINISADNVIVRDNIFDTCRARRGVAINYNSTNVVVSGNIFLDFQGRETDSWCIESCYTMYPSTIVITGNTFTWASNPIGLEVEAAICLSQQDDFDSYNNITISDNVIRSDPSFTNVDVGIWVHKEGTTGDHYNVNVIDNSIYGIEETGIIMNRCSYATVTGNTVFDSGHVGIHIAGGDHSLVSDNYIYNVGQSTGDGFDSAIRIEYDSDYTVYVDNYIYDPNNYLLYAFNITRLDQSDYNVFKDNVAVGVGTLFNGSLGGTNNLAYDNQLNTTIDYGMISDADYLIYKDDSDVVYCVGGQNGTILSSSAVDDVPIQWAIDHLPLDGSEQVYGSGETTDGHEGGLIFIKSGFYNITATLDISDIEAVTLMGAGASTVLNNTQTGGQACISASSASWYHRVAIKDMLVQGNTASGDGVYLRNINYPYITGCTFQRHGDDGVHISSAAGGTENQIISDCHFLFNDMYGLHLEDTHDNLISNCHFEENDVHGLLADGCADLLISNCNLEDGYGDYELNITNGRHIRIENIVVEGNVTIDMNIASTYTVQMVNCYVGGYPNGGYFDLTGDDERFYGTACQFSIANISCGGDILLMGGGVTELVVTNADDMELTNCDLTTLNVTSADEVIIGDSYISTLDVTCDNLKISNSYFNFTGVDVDEYVIITGCYFWASADNDTIVFDEKCMVSNSELLGGNNRVIFQFDTASAMMTFTGNNLNLGSAAYDGVLIDGNGQTLPRLSFTGNNLRTTRLNISGVDVITMSGNTFVAGMDVYFYDCDGTFTVTGNTFYGTGGNCEPIFDATCSGLCVISGNILEDSYTDNTGGAVTFTVTGNAP